MYEVNISKSVAAVAKSVLIYVVNMPPDAQYSLNKGIIYSVDDTFCFVDQCIQNMWHQYDK